MSLNMKPGQFGRIARPARTLRCPDSMLNMVVQVDHLATPNGLRELAVSLVDGPLWALRFPVRCTCGNAFTLLPDSILQPFDPESDPGQEDNEGADPDIKAPTSEGIAHG